MKPSTSYRVVVGGMMKYLGRIIDIRNRLGLSAASNDQQCGHERKR